MQKCGIEVIMSGLVEAVKRATALLDEMRVPYMVFGGIANSIYGNPRLTFDVDIKFLLEQPDEMERFLAGIASIATILPRDPKRFIRETNVLPVDINGVRTDLVKAELPFEKEAIARSRAIDFYGATIRVCTAEDLIIQKAVSTREKDWHDIKCIIENQHDRMNWAYLLKHCQELARFLDRKDIHDKIKGWLNEESL
jgi:predicted nucleotidyltransferase